MEQNTFMVNERHDTLRADCIVIRIIKISSKMKNVTADTAGEKACPELTTYSILLAFSTLNIDHKITSDYDIAYGQCYASLVCCEPATYYL